jgi:GNAT superfamily N-acetyltransferase
MTVADLARRTRIVEGAWCAAWASLGAVTTPPRTLVEETPALLRVITPGAPETLLNIILRYNSIAPVTRTEVERAIAPYRAERLPFQWWLTPGDEPPGLREQLRALGMQTWGGAAAMTLDLARWLRPRTLPPVASGVTLGRVATPRDEHGALDVICEVFYVPTAPMARWTIENPIMQVYLARHGDEAVSALCMLWQAGVAGISNVATIHEARRRGIAGALMVRALDDARDAGCQIAALTATPEARRLYETLGFDACGVIEQWAPGRELTLALTHGRPLPQRQFESFWE